MERRNFIRLATIGTGMCLIPPALYFVAPSIKEYACVILKRELYYLKLEPKGVVSFVDDYFKATGNDLLSNLKWKGLFYLKSGWDKSDRVRDLLKYYLLSSDFFINKTDESKTVNYLGLFNSYKSPMPNPYSFILYPPSDIKEV